MDKRISQLNSVSGASSNDLLVIVKDGVTSNITTNDFFQSYTGNTSGSCITDLYVSNMYGCSPITFKTGIVLEEGGIVVPNIETGTSVNGVGIDSQGKLIKTEPSGNTPKNFIRKTFSYSDFQPNDTSIGSLSGFTIPDGNHILHITLREIIPFSISGTSVTKIISLSTDITNGPNIGQINDAFVASIPMLDTSNNQTTVSLSLVGSPFNSPTIDELTEGEFEILYNFEPIIIT